MTFVDFLWVTIAVFGALNSGFFAVSYHIKSHGSWAKHMMGRNLMGLAVVVCALMTMLSVAFFTGGIGPEAWIIGLVLFNAVILQRNYMLFSKKWQSRAADPSGNTIEHVIGKR